jgi:NOP5NT (NUC127) domain
MARNGVKICGTLPRALFSSKLGAIRRRLEVMAFWPVSGIVLRPLGAPSREGLVIGEKFSAEMEQTLRTSPCPIFFFPQDRRFSIFFFFSPDPPASSAVATMPVPDYLLSESATGYALYQVTESEEIGARTREFLETINDISRFSKFVKLVSFVPFKNAAQALENINDVSEGLPSPPHTPLNKFVP